MPPEESDTAQTKARTRIGRRDAILKGLAGVGVAASGAIGLSALASPASAAIQDATYLVQDPSPDLTAEKVVGTDLTLSGWDYIVWTNGTTVYGQNGRGTDWAAIVNSIIGTVGAETIFVHPDVPASTTTINVNKSGVTIYCPKTNLKDEVGPYTQKIILGGNSAAQVRRATLWGLEMDELEISAPSTSFDVDGWTVGFCRMNSYSTVGRQGLRFTGPGDIENGLFLHCRIRAQNNGVNLVTVEAKSDANGHIAFYRCQLENVGGFTGVDSIEYSSTGPGHTGTIVTFTDCSFVHTGGAPTGGCILRMSGTTLDAGPRKLIFTNPHIQIDQAGMDLFQIVNATAFVYYGVVLQNPSLTVGANTYTWIQNSNLSNFAKGSMLQIRGGHLTGSTPTSFTLGASNESANFKVMTADVVRFNPQGAAAITRNNEKFHLAVWLEPSEAITVTYSSGSGDTLSMTKDRK